MWPWVRPSKRSLSAVVPAQVDFLNLCDDNVHKIEDLAKGDYLLNKRQCEDLSTKLSKIIQNIQVLVLHSGASPDLFKPALKNLYRYLEKAKLLVQKCGEEDWCAAAVFQIQNENAFREILLGVGLCYNAIYEQAKTCRGEEWNDHLKDLRKSSIFLPATALDVRRDQEGLQSWLEYFVNEPSSVIQVDQFEAPRRALQQCLAKYLLVKLNYKSEQSQTNTFDGCSAILWTKESELPDVWTNSHFLGSGAGANGVCSIKWLGIPCAKKEFHEPNLEPIFLKEAGILAALQHPRIVNFICCGHGEDKGDCFIATELMEKSLFDQIKHQKEQFSLPVVVDMMVQMAQGMLYLHDRGVAHRDLKPHNVVVNRLTGPHLANYFCVKLVDFGMSKTKVEVSKSKTISFPGVGTTTYRAPEVHPNAHRNGKRKVNWFKADVYSFAITCAHVLSLKPPFDMELPLSDFYHELLNGTRPELPSNCPEELVSLLKDCWNSNYRSRPSFKEICTRLERFHYKILRGFSTVNHSFQVKMDFSTGFDFIEKKMEEQSSINKSEFVDKIDSTAEDEVYAINRTEEVYEISKAEEVAEFDEHDVLSIMITCTSNHALEFREKSTYSFNCNMCRKSGMGSVYHCETCEFDAHPDCAQIKKKVTVLVRNAPVRLQIQNCLHEDLDATCGFCQESLQDSEWVYKSEQGSFNRHILCTKYSPEMNHHAHPHLLTLVECSPPHKICKCCCGNIKGNYYTCAELSCSFELHPFCAILPIRPRCTSNTRHEQFLVTDRRWSFRCVQCHVSSSSWCYYCEKCRVNRCLGCVGDPEEDDDWNMDYEKFTLKYGTNDAQVWDHITMIDMISKLVDRLSVSDPLEASSSSSSRSEIPAMKMRRKVKAKPNLAEQRAKLEYLETLLPDPQLYYRADEDFLAATHEKLLKKRQYIVQKENASQMQS